MPDAAGAPPPQDPNQKFALKVIDLSAVMSKQWVGEQGVLNATTETYVKGELELVWPPSLASGVRTGRIPGTSCFRPPRSCQGSHSEERVFSCSYKSVPD